MTLGLGRASLVRIPTNDRFELRPDRARGGDRRGPRRGPSADRRSSRRVGTTSSTSVDPVAAIADIAAREGLWLHVDAAYAGAVAIDPGLRAPFAGWERADSIVVNPHKWLWTPVDASLLLSRRLDVVRDAFSLVPEYLRTVDAIGDGTERNYNEYTPQLGRRFRALKLWFDAPLVRARRACDGGSATTSSSRRSSPAGSMPRRTGSGWPRSRSRPSASGTCRRALAGDDAALDAHNAAVMDAVNRIRRGVPEPHEASRPVHDPAGDRQPAHRATATSSGRGSCSGPQAEEVVDPMSDARSPSSTSTGRKWGAHDEFVGLFRKNHWPVLREQLADGRFTAVEMSTPRFHGDGRADWDVLVSITYRDWAAMEAHSEAEIAARLFPDQETFKREEQRRFELLEAHWDVPLEASPAGVGRVSGRGPRSQAPSGPSPCPPPASRRAAASSPSGRTGASARRPCRRAAGRRGSRRSRSACRSPACP